MVACGYAPGQRLIPILSAWLAFWFAGCAGSDVGKTYPVNGKVLFNGEPLTADSTVILFEQDAAHGNQTPFRPAGTVDEAGNYVLNTQGTQGAPPGWYKVVVTALASAPEHPKMPAKRQDGPSRSRCCRPGMARQRPPTWPSRWSSTPLPGPTI
jgi:hypothetical protein